MSPSDREPSGAEPIERVSLPSGVDLRVIRWEPDGSGGGATGDQAPWLLVHGLASNARLWDGVGARLAAAGHRAVAVDQRGHGRSSKPDDGYDTPTVADDLPLLLDELGWDRANVAGQSWGGNVVVELAHRHPSRIASVVGVDGGSIRLADQWPDWEDCAEALAPPPLLGRSVAEIESWLAGMAADWPEEGRAGTLANFEIRDDATIAPWLTFERHLAVLRGLWEHDPFERFPTLEPPLLLIGAGPEEPLDATQLARTERMNAAADMAGGESLWFRPAHHDVHAQRPAEVTEALLAFASRVSSTGPTTRPE